MRKILDKYVHISVHKYIEEMIEQYEKKHGTISKAHTPKSSDKHLELDESEFWDNNVVRQMKRKLKLKIYVWQQITSVQILHTL